MLHSTQYPCQDGGVFRYVERCCVNIRRWVCHGFVVTFPGLQPDASAIPV